MRCHCVGVVPVTPKKWIHSVYTPPYRAEDRSLVRPSPMQAPSQNGFPNGIGRAKPVQVGATSVYRPNVRFPKVYVVWVCEMPQNACINLHVPARGYAAKNGGDRKSVV